MTSLRLYAAIVCKRWVFTFISSKARNLYLPALVDSAKDLVFFSLLCWCSMIVAILSPQRNDKASWACFLLSSSLVAEAISICSFNSVGRESKYNLKQVSNPKTICSTEKNLAHTIRLGEDYSMHSHIQKRKCIL